jgi:hypothetical protein
MTNDGWNNRDKKERYRNTVEIIRKTENEWI